MIREGLEQVGREESRGHRVLLEPKVSSPQLVGLENVRIRNGQLRSLSMQPTLDVSKSIGELQGYHFITCVLEFFIPEVGNTTKFNQDKSQRVIRLRSLSKEYQIQIF